MLLNKNFEFISKAQTLNKLKKTNKNQFIIPKFFFFSKKDYTDKKKIDIDIISTNLSWYEFDDLDDLNNYND